MLTDDTTARLSGLYVAGVPKIHREKLVLPFHAQPAPAEMAILRLLMQGYTNSAIAEILT